MSIEMETTPEQREDLARHLAAQQRKEALRLAQANARKAVRPVAGLPPLPRLPNDGEAAAMSRVLEICRPLPEQKDAA